MPTNFELERLKPKIDIFKIPENRVHELTDSNVSRGAVRADLVGTRTAWVAHCAHMHAWLLAQPRGLGLIILGPEFKLAFA